MYSSILVKIQGSIKKIQDCSQTKEKLKRLTIYLFYEIYIYLLYDRMQYIEYETMSVTPK